MSIKISENDFQQTVIEAAQALGWRAAHFRGVRVQRQDGSVYYQTPVQANGKGFPDLVLVRERVIWVEIKAQAGKLSPEQEEWRDALIRAGQEWYLWKPEDWETVLEVLQ